MERRTEFNLTTAIGEWKEVLMASGNFNDEQVLELESHLMDEMDRIPCKELSPEEVFFVAQRRIGSTDTLSTAFNPFGKLSFQKISWGLQAILFLFLFKEMTLLFTYFSSDLITFNDLSTGGISTTVAIVSQVISITVLLLIFKRLMRLNKKYRDSFKSNIFMISILLSTFLVRAIYFYIVDGPSAVVEPMIVASTLSFVPPVFVILGIILITVKERRSRKFSDAIAV